MDNDFEWVAPVFPTGNPYRYGNIPAAMGYGWKEEREGLPMACTILGIQDLHGRWTHLFQELIDHDNDSFREQYEGLNTPYNSKPG